MKKFSVESIAFLDQARVNLKNAVMMMDAHEGNGPEEQHYIMELYYIANLLERALEGSIK